MIKKRNGKQCISINIEARYGHERKTWYFSANQYHSTGVEISVEQFDILKEMVNDHRIVEFYERLRRKQN